MSQEFVSLVNKATTPGPMEDWDTILQISEILNHRPDESSNAIMTAIEQKLRSNNVEVQLLALTLLDSCIKNGPAYFIRIVAAPNNFGTVNALTRSNNAQIRERVAELIKEWQPEFQKSQTTSPMSPMEPQPRTTQQPQRNAPSQPSPQQPQQPKVRSREEKRQKLEQDIKVVHETADLLTQLVKSASSPQDLKEEHVLQVVYNCDEMHRRLVALIEKIPEEALLLYLIESNEMLCAAIDFYELYKKNGTKNESILKPIGRSQQPQQPQKQQSPIDLDDIFPVHAEKHPTYSIGSPVSLDDLLNMPSHQPVDTMAREFQQIENSQSNSGFGALARRHVITPTAPPVHEEVPKQQTTSPNPFDDIGYYPNRQQPNQLQSMYPQQPQEIYPPEPEPAPVSGFAAIAKRKDPSKEFDQYLDHISKKDSDDPFA